MKLGKMEECLGVNGRQLSARVDCNLEEREHVLLVQNVLLYNIFYGKPCIFSNGLRKLSCNLYPQWINNVVLYLISAMD